MNDAGLGAFAAMHCARYEPHAAGAAVAGAAVVGQVDAVGQSSVQQQLAAARQKAIAIDSNLVSSCHCLSRKASTSPSAAGARDLPCLRFLGCSANQAFSHHTEVERPI